jgi:hypothetical protein
MLGSAPALQLLCPQARWYPLGACLAPLLFSIGYESRRRWQIDFSLPRPHTCTSRHKHNPCDMTPDHIHKVNPSNPNYQATARQELTCLAVH